MADKDKLREALIGIKDARNVLAPVRADILADLTRNMGPTIPQELHAIAKDNLASAFCERLNEYCRQFDKQLDAEHEIGARLVSYGQALTIYVDDLGYWNPSLIHFYGVTEDGKTPVQLVQHVSQISFLLVALPKKDPDKPRQPFGFAANATHGEEEPKAK